MINYKDPFQVLDLYVLRLLYVLLSYSLSVAEPLMVAA